MTILPGTVSHRARKKGIGRARQRIVIVTDIGINVTDMKVLVHEADAKMVMTIVTHRDRDGRSELSGTQGSRRVESPEEHTGKSFEDKQRSRDHSSENYRDSRDGDRKKTTD